VEKMQEIRTEKHRKLKFDRLVLEVDEDLKYKLSEIPEHSN